MSVFIFHERTVINNNVIATCQYMRCIYTYYKKIGTSPVPVTTPAIREPRPPAISMPRFCVHAARHQSDVIESSKPIYYPCFFSFFFFFEAEAALGVIP